MMAFAVADPAAADPAAADPAARDHAGLMNRFVGNLKLITSAVSLGHDESLIVHVSGDGPRVAAYPPEFKRWGHLRFSVGIEDAVDIIADLRQALDATFGALR